MGKCELPLVICSFHCNFFAFYGRSLIQFICTLWSFFTVKPEDLGEFVFFIFDLKKTGEMPYSEVTNIVKQIHRRYYEESATLKPLVKKMVKGPGGSGGKPLTPNAFKIWSAANPDVCRPIVGKQVVTFHVIK